MAQEILQFLPISDGELVLFAESVNVSHIGASTLEDRVSCLPRVRVLLEEK